MWNLNSCKWNKTIILQDFSEMCCYEDTFSLLIDWFLYIYLYCFNFSYSTLNKKPFSSYIRWQNYGSIYPYNWQNHIVATHLWNICGIREKIHLYCSRSWYMCSLLRVLHGFAQRYEEYQVRGTITWFYTTFPIWQSKRTCNDKNI